MTATTFPRQRQAAILGFVIATSTAFVGCTTERQTRGYIFDEEVAATLAPGVDNRRSVTSTLGSPSATSGFGPEVWYYVSRRTRKKAFLEERPIDQTILEIRFDDGGTVDNIKRYSLADANAIDPRDAETPARAKTLTFFEQLFSNIGRFAGPGGPGGPGGP